MVLKGRVMFLRILVALITCVLIGRTAWVQVVKADEIKKRSEEIRLVRQTITPIRGKILDRNGRALAVTVPSYQVVANQLQIENDQEELVARGMAEVLGLKREDVLKTLRANPESGRIVLASHLTLQQKEAVEAHEMKVVNPKTGKTTEVKIPGIALVLQTQRQYPDHFTANKIVGYMSDGAGVSGLEGKYDRDLSGTDGYVIAEFTHGNMPIADTIKDQKAPVPGRDLILTIDAPLQQLIEKKLEDVMKQTKAKRALSIVMDVTNGEILVMAERPGADPGDMKTWGEPIDYSRLNSWAVTPTPMGSIFKTITTAAALEERAITLKDTFIDKGEVWIDGWRVMNWDGYLPPNPKPMTIAELLQRSSNVGLIQVGQKIPRETFLKYLRGFGFMEKTGIDLAYEEEANFGETPFEKKYNIDWANMYIGQHLELTPIQMVTAVSAIANGGRLVQPHLVREQRDPDGKVVWTAPAAAKKEVISEQTAREVRDLMVSVIEQGTAGLAKAEGYTTGGKTGTAQKFERGRMKERMGAHFVGFAPAKNPKIAMLVMIDEPEGQGFGGMLAAPVFGEMVPHIMRALGIAPDKAPSKPATPEQPKVVSQAVPDVTWLPTVWAEARLAEAGFVPRTTGAGQIVAAQSIKAGAATKQGSVVELVLTAASPPDGNVRVPDFTGLTLTEANRLATELGLNLVAGGAGFVASQEPAKGAFVPARSTLNVKLEARR